MAPAGECGGGREGAAGGHEEGEGEQEKVVGGGDGAEDGGGEEEVEAVEEQGEGEVEDDCGGEEGRGGGEGMPWCPLEGSDGRVVDKPAAEQGHDRGHLDGHGAGDRLAGDRFATRS